MGHKGVVSGYTIFTSISQLISVQRDPRVLGHHTNNIILVLFIT